MAALLKLARGAPAAPSESRVRLAEAITAHQAATERLKGIKSALDGDEGRVSFKALWAAEADVTKAQEDLEATKKAASNYLLADAMGTAQGDAPDLAAARLAVTAAEDRVAAIRAARQTLANELKPAEEAVANYKNSISFAKHTVLHEEIGAIVEPGLKEVEALDAQLVDKHLALFLLANYQYALGQGPGTHYTRSQLGEISGRFTYPMQQWRLAHVPEPSPSRSKWQAAIEALDHDAYAKLPDVL